MLDKMMMLKVEDVSIRYKLGDFKDIGLKEWTNGIHIIFYSSRFC